MGCPTTLLSVPLMQRLAQQPRITAEFPIFLTVHPDDIEVQYPCGGCYTMAHPEWLLPDYHLFEEIKRELVDETLARRQRFKLLLEVPEVQLWLKQSDYPLHIVF